MDGHDCALEQRGVDTNLTLRAPRQPPRFYFEAFFHSSSIIISIVGKALMDPMMERSRADGLQWNLTICEVAIRRNIKSVPHASRPKKQHGLEIY
jgi:hypothetical protein